MILFLLLLFEERRRVTEMATRKIIALHWH
jgi:hypothetical protein